MDYNYHTHTTKCSHATGTEREYIERAIENGIKYMGFSEHVPFVLPDGSEFKFRLPTKDAEKYFADINLLREEFKDKIDIKIGFEMEYYPDYFEKTLKYVLDLGAEYLILGQHFLRNELSGIPGTYRGHTDPAYLTEYVDTVITAMKSGYFTYIAHPDVFKFLGDDEIYISEMRRLCRASTEYNIPLEVNFSGIRTENFYPGDKFWKIAGEEQSPTVFGFDAHEAIYAYDGESLVKAKEFVKKHNLNYIGKPEIILIQEK